MQIVYFLGVLSTLTTRLHCACAFNLAQGRFASGGFICHCRNVSECNNTTFVDAGDVCAEGCADGWSGPACQIGNVVNEFNATAEDCTHCMLYTFENATKADCTTCKSPNNSYSIHLPAKYKLYSFTLIAEEPINDRVNLTRHNDRSAEYVCVQNSSGTTNSFPYRYSCCNKYGLYNLGKYINMYFENSIAYAKVKLVSAFGYREISCTSLQKLEGNYSGPACVLPQSCDANCNELQENSKYTSESTTLNSGDLCDHICDTQGGCTCTDGEICETNKGLCFSDIVGSSCETQSLSLLSFQGSKVNITQNAGQMIVTVSSDISDIGIKYFNISYQLQQKHQTQQWKYRLVAVNIEIRNKREVEDTEVEVTFHWKEKHINAPYLMTVAPVFSDGTTGEPSEVFTYVTDCSVLEGTPGKMESCEFWCLCSDNQEQYCLKTCNHCYSCDREPKFPADDDVTVRLSDITHNSITLHADVSSSYEDLPITEIHVQVKSKDVLIESKTFSDFLSVTHIFRDLDEFTNYMFLVYPVVEYRNDSRTAYPIITSNTTKQQPSDDKLILIVCIVAAFVFILTIVVVVFMAIKRQKNKKIMSKKHMDENYYNSPISNNIFSESPTKKTQSEPEVKLEITEKPRPAIPIKIEDLQSYITANKNKVGGLEDEFNQIPSNKEATTAEGDMPENYDKNRFTNIKAYDHSRVVLYLLPRDPRSTYINASYISSYSKKKQFIASQAPRTSTVDDMWRMIWQKEINSVVMLTNLKEGTRVKSHQYWPSRGERNYGDVSVSILSTSEFAFYTERHFVVALGNKQRHVTHMQFTSWPDHGVPKTPTEFLEFYYKVKSLDRKRTGPLLVHCSAGVGRTGTFIAVDYLLEQSRIEGVVDVFACVATMRRDRVDMVQTEQQYRFIYETLREALYIGPTAVPVADYDVTAALMTSRKKDQSQLQKEFKLLNDMFPPVELSKENSTYDGSLPPQTRDTSDSSTGRSSNTDDRMVYVSGKEVLSAVLCDSYREKSSTIISQIPTYQQAEHFWHLLVQHQVCGVVLLDDIPEEHQYWPKLESPDRFTSHLIVRTASISEDRETGVVERNFEMIEDATRSTKVIPVRQWQIKSWIKGTVFSDHCKAMMKIKSDMHQWAGSGDRAGSRVLVQCGTGLDKSAMFVALCCAVDKVEIDRMVDVAFAVKFLRQSKKSAVATYEQYKELHQAMELVTDEKGEYYNTASVAE